VHHSPPAIKLHQRVYKSDGISFYDDIQILAGLPEQQIAHKTAHDVYRHVQACAFLANYAQQYLAWIWNGILQQLDDIFWAGKVVLTAMRAN